VITVARLRNFGVPSLKVRRFAGTIKGEPASRALAILELQNSPACQALHKLLKSAIANAEHNNGLTVDGLVVSNVLVDNGPMMKRIRPRARGRAFRIFKRTSHVAIELDLGREAKAAQEKAGLGQAAAAKVQKSQAAKAPMVKTPPPAAKASAKPAAKTAAKPSAKVVKPAAAQDCWGRRQDAGGEEQHLRSQQHLGRRRNKSGQKTHPKDFALTDRDWDSTVRERQMFGTYRGRCPYPQDFARSS
jgi:large subunit ribosomal protein L22